MKLSCRPLTLNPYKAFLKNKNRSGKIIYFIFYKIFEKKKKNSVTFYYLTPDLKLPAPSEKKFILLPAKFHFNPQWGNFYNMLFLSFKKGLNDQNDSSSDSHHYIKIPLPAQFIISRMGRYLGVPTSVENMRRGGLELIHMGRLKGGGGEGGYLICY